MSGENGQEGLKPSIRAGWLGFLYRLHGSPDMLHSTGPLLSIDVGERTTVETDITEVQERYIGGRGVATRLAHERVPFDADPLGPRTAPCSPPDRCRRPR